MAKINKDEYEFLKDLDDKWKWIAMDKVTHRTDIHAYSDEPRKSSVSNQWIRPNHIGDIKQIDSDLFQFIQWEDESPYNIQELIKEYEKDYKGSWEHAIEFSKEMRRESEGTEVSFKEKLKQEVEKIMTVTEYDGGWTVKKKVDVVKLFDLINQLDEPEITEEQAWGIIKDIYGISNEAFVRSVTRLVMEHVKDDTTIGEIREKLESEVLSQEWVRENQERKGIHFYVNAIKLQNLLVPKQEEADRAYKDGYENGKEHATEKQTEETETVAKVLVDYLIAYAKFKQALSMKVEELEE